MNEPQLPKPMPNYSNYSSRLYAYIDILEIKFYIN